MSRPDNSTKYTVTLTANQIFSFAALERRLGAFCYSQDGPSVLRTELAAALREFVNLLPEPTEEDGEAYLSALDAGGVPNWDGDTLPLTETPDQFAARLADSAVTAR